jgi:hypothetical protein
MLRKRKDKITVVKWISYKEAESKERKPIHKDDFFYSDDHKEKKERNQYYNALKESIIKNKIRFSGTWHQNDPHGAPLFSDGTSATWSMRAWGCILAGIWSDIDGVDYDYVDFAWTDVIDPNKVTFMEVR